jgi:hypothetical protein
VLFYENETLWFRRKAFTIGRLDKNSKATAQRPAKKTTRPLGPEKWLPQKT